MQGFPHSHNNAALDAEILDVEIRLTGWGAKQGRGVAGRNKG